nr:immunoglobulin light chain junction region [Macaca mulatta]MOW02626.1 immunoglobulin light chain junction region [Macaca mulatta]MOW03712.1 immunoglobulin light chain junction region [Macaca mulatta]
DYYCALYMGSLIWVF